jgi:hypothetical protein
MKKKIANSSRKQYHDIKIIENIKKNNNNKIRITITKIELNLN